MYTQIHGWMTGKMLKDLCSPVGNIYYRLRINLLFSKPCKHHSIDELKTVTLKLFWRSQWAALSRRGPSCQRGPAFRSLSGSHTPNSWELSQSLWATASLQERWWRWPDPPWPQYRQAGWSGQCRFQGYPHWLLCATTSVPIRVLMLMLGRFRSMGLWTPGGHFSPDMFGTVSRLRNLREQRKFM